MRRAFLALALLCATPAYSAALTNEELASHPPCAALDSGNPENDAEIAERIAIVRHACRLPIDDVTPAQAEAALGAENLAVVREGDALTVFARAQEANALTLGGGGSSLRGPMMRIGQSPFAATRYRLADLDHALISLMLSRGDGASDSLQWRGPQALAAPEPKAELAGRIVERTLRSGALGETRRLQIYLPPGHHDGGDYAAVFMGDGDFVRAYARFAEPLIERGAIPPVVIVGALAGQNGIVEDRSALGDQLRNLDYLPNFQGDADRFPRHMRFFSDELAPYAVRAFAVTTDRRRRIVLGHSSSAAFAFWAAYLHPEVFANAIVMSQAGRPVDDITPSPVRARFFMNAGLYEQPFLRTTRRTAAALRAQGYDVTVDEIPAGHNDQSAIMFVDRLQRIFSPAPNSPPDR